MGQKKRRQRQPGRLGIKTLWAAGQAFAWRRALPLALVWVMVVVGLWWVLLPDDHGLGPSVPALATGGGEGAVDAGDGQSRSALGGGFFTMQPWQPGVTLLKEVLRLSIPGLRAVEPSLPLLDFGQLNSSQLLRRFMEAGGGLTLNQPWTLLAAEMPFLGAAPAPVPAPPGQPSAAKPAITLPSRAPRPAPSDQPLVLIYHTHGTESFLGPIPAGSGINPDIDGFTPDTERNMIRVGQELSKMLADEYGIGVVHVPDLFDWQNNAVTRIGAYYRSLQMLENLGGAGQSATDKYPNLMLMLDLHRDAVPRAASLSTIGRQQAARVLFIIGTRSQDHPNWQQNMCVANKLNDLLEESYPGLSRGVRQRGERFNQHLLPGALLIEIGSVENTLAEALATARLLGHVIHAALERDLLPQPGRPVQCAIGQVS